MATYYVLVEERVRSIRKVDSLSRLHARELQWRDEEVLKDNIWEDAVVIDEWGGELFDYDDERATRVITHAAQTDTTVKCWK